MKLNHLKYEQIYVDNKSTDNSRKILTDICKNDKNIKSIFNSKNYGPFVSNFNALKFVKGDLIIINFPSDNQDPPEIIIKLLDEIKKGYDAVYGINTFKKDRLYLKFLRKLFYKFINISSSNKHPVNANEFICISKKLNTQIIKNKDYYPYIRGYIGKITGNVSHVKFQREERHKGKSKNSLLDLYDQAFNAIISTVDKPFKILTVMSGVVLICSLFLILYAVILKLINPEIAPKGITFLTISILSMFSFLTLILSIILEYIVALHNQIRFNLEVSIEKKINF